MEGNQIVMGDGFGMGGMWGFWGLGLLVLIGLVLLIVLAVRVLGGGISRGSGTEPGAGDRVPGRSRARETLDERYARGELSTEEYRERLETLGEG